MINYHYKPNPHFGRLQKELTDSSVSDIDDSIAKKHDRTHSIVDSLDHSDKADYIDSPISPMVLTGGVLSDGTNAGTAKVTALTALLRTTDSAVGALTKITLSKQDNLAIGTTDTVHYVKLDYNSGSPQILVQTTVATGTNQIDIGTCMKDSSNNVHFCNCGKRLQDGVSKLHERAVDLRRIELATGCTIGETGTRNVTILAGIVYEGVNKLTPFSGGTFDTSGTDTFTLVYRDGGGGWTLSTGQTQISNTEYDDSDGTPGTVLPQQYGLHWVYLHPSDEHIYVVYGQDSYTKAEAAIESYPASLPVEISDFAVLLGKIMIKRDSATFEEVQMVTDTFFSGTGVEDHNELANLQGGTPYYHLTSAEYSALHTQDTDTILDNGGSNEVHASEIVKNIHNNAINSFKIAIENSLSFFNMIDGVRDVYTDETGIDTVNSVDEYYDSTDDFYRPAGGGTIGVPYAHYKCNNDAEDTIVTDDGSGSNNGVASTNTSNLSVVGKINDAFEFVTANSEYVNIDALQADIAADNTGSFSFWCDTEAAAGFAWAFGDTDADSFIGASIYGVADGNFYIKLTGTVQYQVTYDAPSADYHHYVFVQDGSQFKLYIDDTEVTLTEAVGTHPGYWMNDVAGLDNGRIGCRNLNTGGNISFFTGKIDDFRYYQNKALTPTEIGELYNGGAGTEVSNPTIDYDNMTLISDTFVAESQPDNVRIVILEEDINAITLNTDLKMHVTRDGGTTKSQVTLTDIGDYDASKKILVGNVDISGQPAGTNMEYELTTYNNKGLKVHASAILWD